MKSFISTAIICVLFASAVLPAIRGEVFASVSVQKDSISVGVNTYGKDNMSGKTDGDSRDSVRILFTHDMHSHLDPFKIEGEEYGGFGRLKTLIDDKRYTAENQGSTVFLLDGGDFSMGTLYQTVYESHGAELTMLGYLGYDATTLGNHEFDYKSIGISNMLHAALENEENDPELTLPELVVSNIDWEINDSEDNKLVKAALEDFGSKEYVIIERNGIKAGIFGVMGQDAENCAPESGIDFGDTVDSAKEMTKALKDEGADIIICLSHSGTEGEPGKTEDEVLAKQVPEIDVILSGHSHTRLDSPIVSGDTYIVSTGEYGRCLGEINLVRNENGRWSLEDYKLNTVDDTIETNAAAERHIEEFRDIINGQYLNRFGYSFDQMLAVNNIEFTPVSGLGKELKEEPLASLIADSYVYAIQKAEGDSYEPVDVVFVPCGTIRDTIPLGEVTVNDIFNISSLGIGNDRIPGYPVISGYLTGAELKTVAEIDVSVSELMPASQIYPSGMRWEFNRSRMIMNRITDVKLVTVKGDEEIEDDRLYRIACGLYSAQMLGTVQDLSKGILSITPKTKDGNPIEDFNTAIIYDENGNELKEWYALAEYVESFSENEDGVPEIPDRYAEPEGRKTEIVDNSIAAILKSPNKIAKTVYAAGTAVVAGVASLGVFTVKKVKKSKKNPEAKRK